MRPEVAHERVGDLRRGVRDRRIAAPDHVGCGQRVVTDQRPDVQLAVALLDAVESRDPVDVDQMRRRGEPKLHHRDQALPAGEHLGVLAVRGEEQRERFVEGRPPGGTRRPTAACGSSLPGGLAASSAADPSISTPLPRSGKPVWHERCPNEGVAWFIRGPRDLLPAARAWFETSFAAPTDAQAGPGRRSPTATHADPRARPGRARRSPRSSGRSTGSSAEPPPEPNGARGSSTSRRCGRSRSTSRRTSARPLAGIAARGRAARRSLPHGRRSGCAPATRRPRAPPDARAAARHPDHHARVALPDAHVAGARDAPRASRR